MSNFTWDRYAARVGLAARPAADLAGLRALHAAQFFSIPFENLDIHLGRRIPLAEAELCAKLLDRRRGGYCFELNGLMLLALRDVGFDARAVLARVHLHDLPSGRTHQLNAVTLGAATWLMDVGFGAGGPRCPLLLEDGWEVRDRFWGYRLERRAPWGWLMSSWEDGWRASYSFDLGHVTPEDIAVANFYTSHAPDTHCTRMRVVSRPTADGRISLRNRQRTRLVGDETLVDEIAEGAETLRVLADDFGIALDAEFADFGPVADE